MKNDIENQIYRANFKLKHGYDPGNYGEMDTLTVILILFFLGYVLFK